MAQAALEDFLVLQTLALQHDDASLEAAARRIEACTQQSLPSSSLQQRLEDVLQLQAKQGQKAEDGHIADISDELLVAELLQQLYKRFREQAIDEIGVHEARYRVVQQELEAEIRTQQPWSQPLQDLATSQKKETSPQDSSLSPREASSVEIARPTAARRGRPPRQPKVEDIATGSVDENEELPRRSGRRRRDTLRSLDLDDLPISAVEQSTRNSSSSLPQPLPSCITPSPGPQERPGHILATRNFPRIAQPFLLSIASHRLASLFAKPLTEREAPGYDKLIHQPQDLKSIRLAVTNGGRALNAMLGEDSGDKNQIWVPVQDEIVPPKGIVNAGQLEKELLRIFANAVIFNPDTVQNKGIGDSFYRRRQARLSKQAQLGIRSGDLDREPTSGNGWGLRLTGESFELGAPAAAEEVFIRDARQMVHDVQGEFDTWHAVERRELDSLASDVVGTPMNLRGSRKAGPDGEYFDSRLQPSIEKDEESPDDEADGSVDGGSARRSKRRRRG